MSLVIIGEAATKVVDGFAAFAQAALPALLAQLANVRHDAEREDRKPDGLTP